VGGGGGGGVGLWGVVGLQKDSTIPVLLQQSLTRINGDRSGGGKE